MSASYVPARGHVVWADLSPTFGHEQSGRRPVIVLSPRDYNTVSGLMVVCPITRQAKGFMFEVRLPSGGPVTGLVLCDQVKSIDWHGRNVEYIATAPNSLVAAVGLQIAKLLALNIK